MNTDPDRLVRRLWLLRERLSSPVSSIPYEVSGSCWGTVCATCSHTGHFTADVAAVERCSRCGAQWPVIDSRVPKGKHHSAGNRVESAYHEFAACVAILARVPEPSRTLYEHHLSPLGGGSRYAISAARALGVVHGPLPEHSFWGHVRRAREIVGLRLAFGAQWAPRRVA